jgi:hypothetical protein
MIISINYISRPYLKNKTRMSTFTTCIQHSTVVLAGAFKKEKNKIYPNWRGRSKTTFVDDKILYLENPKESTQAGHDGACLESQHSGDRGNSIVGSRPTWVT